MYGRKEDYVILWLNLSFSVAVDLGAVIVKGVFYLYLFPSSETGRLEEAEQEKCHSLTIPLGFRLSIRKLFSQGE